MFRPVNETENLHTVSFKKHVKELIIDIYRVYVFIITVIDTEIGDLKSKHVENMRKFFEKVKATLFSDEI